MDILTLNRKPKENLESHLHRVEGTLVRYGLTRAFSRDFSEYMEVFYETQSNGGIMAQYRQDGTEKFSMKMGHVKNANVPRSQIPKEVETDDVFYSIGMDSTLFGLIVESLQSQ